MTLAIAFLLLLIAYFVIKKIPDAKHRKRMMYVWAGLMIILIVVLAAALVFKNGG